MRCDYIAQGVINATNQLDLTIPLVVRLKGTKEQEAKRSVSAKEAIVISLMIQFVRLIEESGLKIYAFDGLDEKFHEFQTRHKLRLTVIGVCDGDGNILVHSIFRRGAN